MPGNPRHKENLHPLTNSFSLPPLNIYEKDLGQERRVERDCPCGKDMQDLPKCES